ncbi:MAG: type II toxin-antitoxin system PemK/MazF family toxin [Candidatus Latescibacteria bacterium]|nr:type II toxin-antitoxin system PemK/MazF family toxin [Candidatus Latescibacterota bacterium]
MKFPKRGEIYRVSLDPTIGTEIAKTRPALIISNDIGNQFSERVVVAPITSQNTEKVYPFEVLIPAGEGGLTQASKVLLDQIRSIDKQRLKKRMGMISSERMVAVDQAIRLSLAV